MVLTPGKLYKIFQPKKTKQIPVWNENQLDVVDRLNHKQIIMFMKYHPHNKNIDGLYVYVLYKDKIGIVATSFLREIE